MVVAASDKQGKASLQLMALKFCSYWDGRRQMDQSAAERRVSDRIPCFLHCMRRTSCSVRGSDQQGKKEGKQAFAAALPMRGIGNLPTKRRTGGNVEVQNARRWRHLLETSFQQGNSGENVREDSSRWPSNKTDCVSQS